MADEQTIERRPIAARKWRFSRVAASWLVRRSVSPNAISLTGMGCGIAAGLLLAATAASSWSRVTWLVAALLILLRLLANMLDGMVALESGKASRLGELFNEVPDRVSDTAILVGLGYAAASDPVLGFVASLFSVFTAYVRAVGKVAGAPQFYSGPMAKPHRMWVVIAVCLTAACVPESLTVRVPADGWTLPMLALGIIAGGSGLTAMRRLLLIRDALREKPHEPRGP